MTGTSVSQFDRGVGPATVAPDLDALDRGRVLGLSQVGRAREQAHLAVGLHHEALEEAEAERVVARQPIHRILREQEHRVELALAHRGGQPLAALDELVGGKMQHGRIRLPGGDQARAMAEICRP